MLYVYSRQSTHKVFMRMSISINEKDQCYKPVLGSPLMHQRILITAPR